MEITTTPRKKEYEMFALSSIVSRPADEAKGSLAHYSCDCSCGLHMANTLLSSMQLDAAEHAAWHNRKAAK